MRVLRRWSSIALLLIIDLVLLHTSFAQKFDNDTSRSSLTGILALPIFYYTPETSFAGGAGVLYLHRDSSLVVERPSNITGDVIYTEKKQITLEIDGDFYFSAGLY
ncbi:MAG: hypothetical protein WBW71_15975, partial [Bacteroidota bacterium]